MSTRAGISQSPHVCGGAPCIANTRIPVWVLAECKRLGMSDQEIWEDYPSITQADLNAAWEYVVDHRDEIEQQIHDNIR